MTWILVLVQDYIFNMWTTENVNSYKQRIKHMEYLVCWERNTVCSSILWVLAHMLAEQGGLTEQIGQRLLKPHGLYLSFTQQLYLSIGIFSVNSTIIVINTNVSHLVILFKLKVIESR